MFVDEKITEDPRGYTFVRQMDDVIVAAYGAPRLEAALDVLVEQARLLIGAHQAALSYIPGANFQVATHAISLSQKYARYRSYDVMPTGEGIWTVVVGEGASFCLTHDELVSHPRWRNFSGKKDARGLEHPPMRGWLATPVLSRTGENLGLLQLSDKYEGDFDAHDLELLQRLVKLIAPTFELQYLNAQLQQRGEALEAQRLEAQRMADDARQARQEAQAAESRLALVASQLAAPPQGYDTVPRTYHVAQFALTDMMACGAAIRGLCREHASEAEFAAAVVRLFYDQFVDEQGRRSFALVRMFQTRPYAELDSLRQSFARRIAADVRPETVCLSLLASVGERPSWSDVSQSAGHLAIPLSSAEAVQRLPMIAQLIHDLGLDVANVVRPDPALLVRDCAARVFHVEQANGSPFIPQQHDFVVPCGIQSVVGFGELLAGGNLFVVIGFTKVSISAEVAKLFSHLSHSTRLGLLRYFDGPQKTEAQMRALDRLLANHEQIVADQERKLRATMADLKRSNADLQQFAYAASHDLQEPLRAVAGYCQLLEARYGGRLDDEARQYIGFAVEGAERMRDLIHGLLEYARVETRGQPWKTVDLAQVVERAQASLNVLLRETGGVVRCENLPIVQADETQMVQLMQNLIGNALKYRSHRPPEVDIAARHSGPNWLVSVRDNGIGFDPKYAERVFVMFQRLHTRKQYPGTGIGLALCKRIVERHGGQIWVDSQPGAGATFYFTLPQQHSGD